MASESRYTLRIQSRGKVCGPYTFTARSRNHAVKRAVKTLERLITATATVWQDGQIVAQINYSSCLGAPLVIDGQRYDKKTFASSFPN